MKSLVLIRSFMFNYAMKSLALIGSHLCTVSSVFSVYFFNLILQRNTEENIFVANTFGFFFWNATNFKITEAVGAEVFYEKVLPNLQENTCTRLAIKNKGQFFIKLFFVEHLWAITSELKQAASVAQLLSWIKLTKVWI